jgi:hypothetical protein
MLPDGTVLKQGMTDDHGQASLVQRPGVSDYVLETQWGAYRIKAPERCWKLNSAAFGSCIEISPREASAAQRQEAEDEQRKDEAERKHRALKASWMLKDIPAGEQDPLIRDTLKQHEVWMKTPAAKFPTAGFTCHTLNLPAPSTEAADWFEQGKTLRPGEKQEQAFVEAARLGHWRAAARLASSAMENEDWEGAQPVIAWLLKKNIPSGYAKLADLIAATSGYDGAQASASTQQRVISLRWRAAQLGDPVAQSQMNQYFAKQNQAKLAADLLACAQQQNPDIR